VENNWLFSRFTVDSEKKFITPYYKVSVYFTYGQRRERLSYNLGEESLKNDNRLLLTICYLKKGIDPTLKDKLVGPILKLYLEDMDLIYDDVPCEIEDVKLFYYDSLGLEHNVSIPDITHIKRRIIKVWKCSMINE
jgi:hypothetical protein